jgi:nucleoside-diphosphate-sugar epimerase
MKTILISGGCGFVGTQLINKLINKYKIISVDTKWFGDYLPKNRNLLNIKDDIANIEKYKLNKIDCAIHLASVANDPMALIDKNLSWETSALNTMKLLEYLKKIKTKRFIYASSGSVYGIKKENKVKEDLELNPISIYNKVKMVTERVILSYKKHFDIFIVRPATICGFSKRMRLDLTVNALTFSALKNKIVNVYGGQQIRPNIHIDDMCDLYQFFINTKEKNAGIYNAGFENLSIINIAKLIQKEIPCKINVVKDTNDPRSYRLDSSKILQLGFFPKKKINDAVKELKDLYHQKKLINKDNYNSLKWLQKKLKK